MFKCSGKATLKEIRLFLVKKKKTVLLLLQRFKTERQAPVSELLAILQFRTMTVVQINLLGCLRHRKVYFKRL